MEKKLSVNNLTISFRTVNGNVQAVRGISFDLYAGETLCIVGESGSGKSVTSRAVLGILARNAMVQNGEIFYDGKDLLKISEDDFHKIRGDKIAMIFQDPMSSLNPIMRVGKQLTEAMILKNKANRRESRRAFNRLLKHSVAYMDNDASEEDKKNNALNAKMFNQFEEKHLVLEQTYQRAKEACEDLEIYVNDVVFKLEKNALNNPKKEVKYIKEQYKKIQNEYYMADVSSLANIIDNLEVSIDNDKQLANKDQLVTALKNVLDIITEVKLANKVEPNFFSLGYYLTFVSESLPSYKDFNELNAITLKELDAKFMLNFISLVEKALNYSNKESVDKSIKVLEELKQIMAMDLDTITKKEYVKVLKPFVKNVVDSIDKLDIYRTSPCYTFRSSIIDAVDKYFAIDKNNAKEETRFKKDTEKYNKIISKGKTPNWEVIPKMVWDKEQSKKELFRIYNNLEEYLEKYINNTSRNLNKEAIAMIDYFKLMASNVATKVTKKVAKNKAIKLLEEVGINDPQRRYKQYPFEFSGGMRQRIVIAIALAANPDILICDEPTTALDVTIQSQILELINKLKRERNLSIIFITHDMGVVANMADRIAVMYAGKIVEIGTSEDVFYDPKHPYTWALLSSMPDLDTKEKLESIPGTPPNMIYPPKGDAFAARNKYAMKIDFEMQPPMFKVSDTHYAATWLLHPDAPKVEPPKTLVNRIKKMKEMVNNNATK